MDKQQDCKHSEDENFFGACDEHDVSHLMYLHEDGTVCGCPEENQKLPSELIKELSQQDFGGRIGIGTIMRAMDHLAKKNNWKV